MRTKTVTAGIGALAMMAAVQPLAAADMPAKAPILKAPPVIYSWTGFYVGGNAGYSWGRATTDQTDRSTSSSITECFRDSSLAGGPLTGALSTIVCAPNTTTTFPIAAGPTTATSGTSSRADVDGFIGGVQAGYNYQFNRSWVAGIEADIQFSDENGSEVSCSVAGCPSGSAFGSASHRLRWFGTVRGRLGWLPTDRVLVYATGGLVYGEFKSDYVTGINGTALLSATSSTTRAGWTVGGGVEGFVTDRWTIKAEYLYADYGDFDTNFGTSGAVTAVGPCVLTGFGQSCTRTTTTTTVSSSANTRFTDHIFRVGLNYHFAPGSVIAKY